MSKSNCEELIGILWIMLSLMLFDREYINWAWVTLGLGIFCQLCSIVFGLMAAIKKHLERK